MKIRIPHHFSRAIGWFCILLGIFMGVMFALAVFVTGGRWWSAPIALICCSAVGGLIGFTYLNHKPKLEITQEGVCAKRFFRTQFYPWKTFIQAGVAWMHNRGRYFHEIVLLLPGGNKREKYDVLFYVRNALNLLYLPYREDILTYLLQGYGKLDFCFLNGSQTEDYYTIQEKTE